MHNGLKRVGKIVLFAVLAIVFIDPAAYAKRRKSSKANQDERGPSQLSIPDKIKNFGMVTRGQKLEWQVEFTNSGSTPLVIQGVFSACGCIIADSAEGQSLAPQQKGGIKVVLDTTDYEGELDKTVSIMTDAKENPVQTLHVIARVKSELTVTPPLVDFGDLAVGESASRTVLIKGATAQELKIEKVGFNEKVLDIGYEFDKVKSEWRLHVRLRPETPPGFLKETVRVNNNSAFLKQLKIPVRANVQGNIALSPSYLEFGAIPPKSSRRRVMDVSTAKDIKLTGSRAEININGTVVSDAARFVKVDLGGGSASNRKVAVELVNPEGKMGSVHGRVILETSDPQQKDVTIDFYAMFQIQ